MQTGHRNHTFKKTRFEEEPKDQIGRRKTISSKKTIKRSMTANSDTFSSITNDNLLLNKMSSANVSDGRSRINSSENLNLGPGENNLAQKLQTEETKNFADKLGSSIQELIKNPGSKMDSQSKIHHSKPPKTEKEVPYSVRVQEFEKKAVRQEQVRLDQANKLSIDKLFDEERAREEAKHNTDNFWSMGKRMTSRDSSMIFNQNDKNEVRRGSKMLGIDKSISPERNHVEGGADAFFVPQEFQDYQIPDNFQLPSEMMKEKETGSKQRDKELKKIDDKEQQLRVQTFFAENANLNESAMVEYGLAHDENNNQKNKKDHKDQPGNKTKVYYMKKFDSRGKEMKIKRLYTEHGRLENFGEDQKQFAVVNFNPQSLVTRADLKQRAASMAFSKYKQIKREFAKKEAQRRLNWFMSIVKAKNIATKWLKEAQDSLYRKQKKAEQESFYRKRSYESLNPYEMQDVTIGSDTQSNATTGTNIVSRKKSNLKHYRP